MLHFILPSPQNVNSLTKINPHEQNRVLDSWTKETAEYASQDPTKSQALWKGTKLFSCKVQANKCWLEI